MSSKIDGVPRELLERLHEIICGDGHHEEGELGNLLDAPIVERQPAGYRCCFNSQPGKWMVEWDKPCRQHLAGMPPTKCSTPPPPELAELQATIAQLEELRDYQAERLNFYIEKVGELTTAIERLKGGQGEPVAHRLEFEDGQKTSWIDGAPTEIDVRDAEDGVLKGIDRAYTSQPAPVSVVSLLKEAYECGDRNVFGTDLDDRIRVYLDKVKELNQ